MDLNGSGKRCWGAFKKPAKKYIYIYIPCISGMQSINTTNWGGYILPPAFYQKYLLIQGSLCKGFVLIKSKVVASNGSWLESYARLKEPPLAVANAPRNQRYQHVTVIWVNYNDSSTSIKVGVHRFEEIKWIGK